MSHPEDGARVRAAQEYAGKDREAIADAIKMKMRTYDRLRSGARALQLPEARSIAKATGVPLLFLTHGWQIYEAIENLAARPDAPTAEELIKRLDHAKAADARTRQSAQPPPEADPEQEAG